MIHESIKAKVKRATVALPRTGGLGVLVTGNLIITAAHCIEFKCEGEMVLGDCFREEIETAHGKLQVQPLAVEPVSDIAVLGSLDNYKETVKFEEFCTATEAIEVDQSDHELFQEFPVYIYTHKGTWVKGRAQQCSEDAPSLALDTDKKIECGTSGGPIINDSGALVGIVSNSIDDADNHGKFSGMAPRQYLTLPSWICRKIFGQKV
ncbi:MAG: serine protease [Syntrophobacteraceae bacterium]